MNRSRMSGEGDQKTPADPSASANRSAMGERLAHALQWKEGGPAPQVRYEETDLQMPPHPVQQPASLGPKLGGVLGTILMIALIGYFRWSESSHRNDMFRPEPSKEFNGYRAETEEQIRRQDEVRKRWRETWGLGPTGATRPVSPTP